MLVEGATERALFNYLLTCNAEWRELSRQQICIVDVLGKYNFHRFMALLEAYGIPHGVILDDDNEQNYHAAINDLVESCTNSRTLAKPVKLANCLETFLGLPVQYNSSEGVPTKETRVDTRQLRCSQSLH